MNLRPSAGPMYWDRPPLKPLEGVKVNKGAARGRGPRDSPQRRIRALVPFRSFHNPFRRVEMLRIADILPTGKADWSIMSAMAFSLVTTGGSSVCLELSDAAVDHTFANQHHP